MIVFRCECAEILSVDQELAGTIGECPSCGLVLRAPTQSVNLKGRLHATAQIPVPALPETSTATSNLPQAVADEAEIEAAEEVSEILETAAYSPIEAIAPSPHLKRNDLLDALPAIEELVPPPPQTQKAPAPSPAPAPTAAAAPAPPSPPVSPPKDERADRDLAEELEEETRDIPMAEATAPSQEPVPEAEAVEEFVPIEELEAPEEPASPSPQPRTAEELDEVAPEGTPEAVEASAAPASEETLLEEEPADDKLEEAEEEVPAGTADAERERRRKIKKRKKKELLRQKHEAAAKAAAEERTEPEAAPEDADQLAAELAAEDQDEAPSPAPQAEVEEIAEIGSDADAQESALEEIEQIPAAEEEDQPAEKPGAVRKGLAGRERLSRAKRKTEVLGPEEEGTRAGRAGALGRNRPAGSPKDRFAARRSKPVSAEGGEPKKKILFLALGGAVLIAGILALELTHVTSWTGLFGPKAGPDQGSGDKKAPDQVKDEPAPGKPEGAKGEDTEKKSEGKPREILTPSSKPAETPGSPTDSGANPDKKEPAEARSGTESTPKAPETSGSGGTDAAKPSETPPSSAPAESAKPSETTPSSAPAESAKPAPESAKPATESGSSDSGTAPKADPPKAEPAKADKPEEEKPKESPAEKPSSGEAAPAKPATEKAATDKPSEAGGEANKSEPKAGE